jgi:ubiquinol-cytochrome c reductase cytochrome c1 subunit
MKKILMIVTLLWVPLGTFAAGGSGVPLDHIKVDATDKVSLQRGMKLYVNYCLGCHSAQYQRYERAAVDLQIPVDLMMEHLVFSGQKVGEQMTNAMDAEQAKGWFGVSPPDLTNEVNLRGADWLYTYMRSFYVDDSRPYGVNNVVFENVGMPNVLAELQGIQRRTCDQVVNATDQSVTESCDLLVDANTGTMSVAEFDQAMYDLTNFLAYVSNPNKLASEALGVKVILFLLLMTLVFYFLYKEYWRDIH